MAETPPRGRAAVAGPARTGSVPVELVEGLLVAFDPVRWTGTFAPSIGGRVAFKDVPVLQPFVSPSGSGASFMPQPGARCLFARPSAGSGYRGFIIGFFAPHAEGQRSHAAGREGFTPGDMLLQLSDGALFSMAAGRGIEIKAEEVCYLTLDSRSGQLELSGTSLVVSTPVTRTSARTLPPEEDPQSRSGSLVEAELRLYVEDAHPSLRLRAGSPWAEDDEDAASATRALRMEVGDADTGVPAAVASVHTTGEVDVQTDDVVTLRGKTAPGTASAVVVAPALRDLVGVIDALHTALVALGAPAVPEVVALIANMEAAEQSGTPYLSRRIFSD